MVLGRTFRGSRNNGLHFLTFNSNSPRGGVGPKTARNLECSLRLLEAYRRLPLDTLDDGMQPQGVWKGCKEGAGETSSTRTLSGVYCLRLRSSRLLK